MRKKLSICVFILGFWSCSFALAQTAQGEDKRVKAALDSEKIESKLDANGDYTATFQLEDGRTQAVTVNSSTNNYVNYEIREIHSVSWSGSGLLADTIATHLLLKNDEYMLGSWSLHKNPDGTMYLLYVIKVAADLPAKVLRNMMEACASIADTQEKLLTPDKDDY
jgi:hypothetical protein